MATVVKELRIILMMVMMMMMMMMINIEKDLRKCQLEYNLVIHTS